MNKLIDIRKENSSRLLMPHLPEILVDNPYWGQEDLFDVHYKGKLVGRARLHYRLPFQAKNLRDSQTYMVYNRPKHWLSETLKREYDQSVREGAEGFSERTWLVYVLLKWEERDLMAFDEIVKEVQGEIIEENPSQHRMQLAV